MKDVSEPPFDSRRTRQRHGVDGGGNDPAREHRQTGDSATDEADGGPPLLRPSRLPGCRAHLPSLSSILTTSVATPYEGIGARSTRPGTQLARSCNERRQMSRDRDDSASIHTALPPLAGCGGYSRRRPPSKPTEGRCSMHTDSDLVRPRACGRPLPRGWTCRGDHRDCGPAARE